jgi:PAS domain S-box-containing protein/putative nucleotidyltransferase with HDIG domain
MEQLGVMSTTGRRRLRIPILGARRTVEIAVCLAAVLLVLPFVDPHMSDVPLLSFMVVIGLCAARFGIRGGIGSGLSGAAIASLWYLQGSHYAGGLVDYLWQAAAFLVVGALVGSAASERRDLERAVSRHSELSVDLICTATFDGFFTRLNPSWERVLGYSVNELTARPFLDFVHPDDRAATLAEVERQTAAGQDVLNFQNRYHCKDGSYRWLEWTSRPDERAGMLFAVARDITARKQAEHALAEHKAALECAVRDRTVELEESRLEMLRRLALAAEYRDDDTFEHTERVGHTAALLAEQLGLPATDLATLRQAAPLHDIGKLGISDTILLKPSKLTDEEFEQIKKHTVDGARILSGSSSDVLELAEQIALHHHERWDGHGYPNRLVGDAVPLCARIVAVADVFDALTHTRPYKHAWPVADALAEIHRNRGSQFDPAVVDAFERLDATTLAGHQPAHVGSPAKPRQLRHAA